VHVCFEGADNFVKSDKDCLCVMLMKSGGLATTSHTVKFLFSPNDRGVDWTGVVTKCANRVIEMSTTGMHDVDQIETEEITL
jgi:hypothetical protein